MYRTFRPSVLVTSTHIRLLYLFVERFVFSSFPLSVRCCSSYLFILAKCTRILFHLVPLILSGTTARQFQLLRFQMQRRSLALNWSATIFPALLSGCGISLVISIVCYISQLYPWAPYSAFKYLIIYPSRASRYATGA